MLGSQDNTQNDIPSDLDESDKGMNKTLVVQGSILGVIVVFLIIASFLDLI